MDPRLFNGNVLAYIGDSVLELMVREHLVYTYHYSHSKELQQHSVDYVSAKAHQDFISYALDHDIFTDEELVYYHRGKNVKEHRTLKNTSRYAHSLSTGFEAVIGYLYLTKQMDRLQALFNVFAKYVEDGKGE